MGIRLHTAFMIIQEELVVHMDGAGSQLLISKGLTLCLQQDPARKHTTQRSVRTREE